MFIQKFIARLNWNDLALVDFILSSFHFTADHLSLNFYFCVYGNIFAMCFCLLFFLLYILIIFINPQTLFGVQSIDSIDIHYYYHTGKRFTIWQRSIWIVMCMQTTAIENELYCWHNKDNLKRCYNSYLIQPM